MCFDKIHITRLGSNLCFLIFSNFYVQIYRVNNSLILYLIYLILAVAAFTPSPLQSFCLSVKQRVTIVSIVHMWAQWIQPKYLEPRDAAVLSCQCPLVLHIASIFSQLLHDIPCVLVKHSEMLDFAAACYIPYDGPRYVQVGVHAAINIQIQFFEQSSKR